MRAATIPLTLLSFLLIGQSPSLAQPAQPLASLLKLLPLNLRPANLRRGEVALATRSLPRANKQALFQ